MPRRPYAGISGVRAVATFLGSDVSANEASCDAGSALIIVIWRIAAFLLDADVEHRDVANRRLVDGLFEDVADFCPAIGGVLKRNSEYGIRHTRYRACPISNHAIP